MARVSGGFDSFVTKHRYNAAAISATGVGSPPVASHRRGDAGSSAISRSGLGSSRKRKTAIGCNVGENDGITEARPGISFPVTGSNCHAGNRHVSPLRTAYNV